MRFFDLEQAKANMLLLAHSGARTIKLVDRTFNCHPGRAKALFAFLIQAEKDGEIPHGVCFHFEVAADLFDEATLELLAAAPKGLIQLEAGLQLSLIHIYPEVGAAMEQELFRQRRNLELIASENIVSPAVMAAMGLSLIHI